MIWSRTRINTSPSSLWNWMQRNAKRQKSWTRTNVEHISQGYFGCCYGFVDDSFRFNVEGVRRRANHNSAFGTLISYPINIWKFLNFFSENYLDGGLHLFISNPGLRTPPVHFLSVNPTQTSPIQP